MHTGEVLKIHLVHTLSEQGLSFSPFLEIPYIPIFLANGSTNITLEFPHSVCSTCSLAQFPLAAVQLQP